MTTIKERFDTLGLFFKGLWTVNLLQDDGSVKHQFAGTVEWQGQSIDTQYKDTIEEVLDDCIAVINRLQNP